VTATAGTVGLGPALGVENFGAGACTILSISVVVASESSRACTSPESTPPLAVGAEDEVRFDTLIALLELIDRDNKPGLA